MDRLQQVWLRVPENVGCLGAGTADSPQGADEAIDGAFGVQGHDIPDMQEAGGRVRHPAAASALTGGAGGDAENFLPARTIKLPHMRPSASACRNLSRGASRTRCETLPGCSHPGAFGDVDALPSHHLHAHGDRQESGGSKKETRKLVKRCR